MTVGAEKPADSIVVVLLAAGAGRRYGGVKQLADIGGEPMVCKSARNALASGAPVIVVTGAGAQQVELALVDLPVRIVRNTAWDKGMGGSIAVGIRHLCEYFPQASGALLCLADQPLTAPSLLADMLARHRVASDRLLVSTHDGVSGPPVLFPRDCFGTLINWTGTDGARSLLAREAARLERFANHAPIDVDTPDDLRRVREWLAVNTMG